MVENPTFLRLQIYTGNLVPTNYDGRCGKCRVKGTEYLVRFKLKVPKSGFANLIWSRGGDPFNCGVRAKVDDFLESSGLPKAFVSRLGKFLKK